MEEKFVIDGMFCFGSTCDDSPRGSDGPYELVHVQLTHEEAMDMGKSFLEERPYTVDPFSDYAEEAREKMVEEDGYSEDEAYEFQVVWSRKLVDECIAYYDEHRPTR